MPGTGRYPCIIGVARRTWHPEDVADGQAPEPLAMWEEVARLAAEDAHAPQALSRLESLSVIYCQSWQYDDPTTRLAERIGASPTGRLYSGIGGSVPQVVVGQTCESIASGDVDLALVVGAEALATVRRLSKAGEKPAWSFRPEERRPFPMDVPIHPSEITHRVFEAYLTFALFESAFRAHLGHPPAAHQRELGRLLSPLTLRAAADPFHAWFPVERSPEEIVSAGAGNRMVAFPYTKLMTAIMDVDMAAALLIASDEQADALGVPRDQRVYLRGWGYAEDPPHVGERSDLWRSPAMASAAEGALSAARTGIDEVAHFDLYSCFASSIEFALEALGLPAAEFHTAPGQEGRNLTVTGGLPYHGGPGSNYLTHSLAAMAETLRRDPGSIGLVSGVGMHMMKHAFGVWSTRPDEGPLPAVGKLPGRPTPSSGRHPLVEAARGEAEVAAYTVLHGRDGRPESALLVCNLSSGERCYARFGEPDALQEAETQELVGAKVQVEPGPEGSNRAIPR